MDQRFVSQRFPRSSGITPSGSWPASAAGPIPVAVRVVDRGAGPAARHARVGSRVRPRGSSIFLRREFGVQVWATDLWNSVSERFQRVRDAGVEDGVFPIHADARSLPFAAEFFDAIICIDAFPYCGGTDDLYLNYLARFVKPGGLVGIAGAGVVQDIERRCSRASSRVVDPGPGVVPPFGGVVAAALGAKRHHGHRSGRHDAGRLAAVAGLAPGDRSQTTGRKSRRWRRTGAGTWATSAWSAAGGQTSSCRSDRLGAGGIHEGAVAQWPDVDSAHWQLLLAIQRASHRGSDQPARLLPTGDTDVGSRFARDPTADRAARCRELRARQRSADNETAAPRNDAGAADAHALRPVKTVPPRECGNAPLSDSSAATDSDCRGASTNLVETAPVTPELLGRLNDMRDTTSSDCVPVRWVVNSQERESD